MLKNLIKCMKNVPCVLLKFAQCKISDGNLDVVKFVSHIRHFFITLHVKRKYVHLTSCCFA